MSTPISQQNQKQQNHQDDANDYSDDDEGENNGGDDNDQQHNLTTAQRKVFVQRELERMKHVINRLQLQESRSSKRAHIAELKAREVESVRHESERDARVREQLMIEQRDKQVKQQQRVAAMREDRKLRAESSRRELRTERMEAARVTKEQHKFINLTLTDSHTLHHDRCVAQHHAIKAKEKQVSTARARTVDKKRETVTLASARSKDELSRKEEELQALLKKAEAMKKRVDESKSVENAANARLQDLCAGAGGINDSTMRGSRHTPQLDDNVNTSRKSPSNFNSTSATGGGSRITSATNNASMSSTK